MNPRIIDYPATHSMDTEWFAIDKFGRVALFDPFDVGCVPEKMFPEKMQNNLGDDLFRIFPMDNRGFPLMTLPEANLLKIKELMIPVLPGEDDWESFFSGIFRFAPGTDFNPFRNDSAEKATYILFLSADENIALVDSWHDVYFHKLLSDNKILERINLSIAIDTGDNPDLVSLLGFYSYMHNGNKSWDLLEPYERKSSPENPVNMDEISMQNDKFVSHFPVNFEEDDMIQPLIFTPCEFWGEYSGYNTPDGTTIRFPTPGQ